MFLALHGLVVVLNDLVEPLLLGRRLRDLLFGVLLQLTLLDHLGHVQAFDHALGDDGFHFAVLFRLDVGSHARGALRLLDGVGLGLESVKAALVRLALDVVLERGLVDEVLTAKEIFCLMLETSSFCGLVRYSRAVDAAELAEAGLLEVDGGVLGLGQVHGLQVLVDLEGFENGHMD